MIPKDIYFRINRGTQTLTFGPDFSGKKYGDANMTLSASSDVVAEPSTLEVPMRQWPKSQVIFSRWQV